MNRRHSCPSRPASACPWRWSPSPPLGACRPQAPADRVRASGHVEATEVQVAPEVGGRLVELKVAEGDRVQVGRPHRPARHDERRAGAAARAGRARPGGRAAPPAPGRRARRGHPPGRGAGGGRRGRRRRRPGRPRRRPRPTSSASRRCSRRTRARRSSATMRRRGATWRGSGCRRASSACAARARRWRGCEAGRPAGGDRRRAGAGRRRRRADRHARAERRRRHASTSPVAGIVTQKLVDVGEILAPRAPIVVVTDLDHAWANVYVDEPVVPRVRLGQAATIFTDAGGAGHPGHGHVHLAEGRVHAAQRADGRGALEARLPHQGVGRQPRRAS